MIIYLKRKTKEKKFHIVVFLIISLLSGCKKAEIITDSNGLGNIKGTINMFDELGMSPNDRSGVKMNLSGTNYSSITDRNGQYEFKNIPKGSYTLIAEKDNYGQVSFPNQNNNVSLYEIPNVSVTSFEINGSNYTNYSASITLNDNHFNGSKNVILIFSTSQNINFTDISKSLNYSQTISAQISFTNGVGTYSLNYSLNGYVGTTLYYTAFITNQSLTNNYSSFFNKFYNNAISSFPAEKSILIQ